MQDGVDRFRRASWTGTTRHVVRGSIEALVLMLSKSCCRSFCGTLATSKMGVFDVLEISHRAKSAHCLTEKVPNQKRLGPRRFAASSWSPLIIKHISLVSATSNEFRAARRFTRSRTLCTEGCFRRSNPILLVVLWFLLYCDGRHLWRTDRFPNDGCIGSDGRSEYRPYEDLPGYVKTASASTDNGLTSFGATIALNLP